MMKSLRLRLTIGAVIAVGVSIFMVWYTLSGLFTAYVTAQYAHEMNVLTDSLAARVSFANGRMELQKEPADPRFDLPGGGRYWQLSTAGGPSVRSRSLWDTEITPALLTETNNGEFFQMQGPAGTPILVLKRDLSLEDNNKTYQFTIHTGFEKNELEAALTSFHDEMRRMLIATAGVLLGAAFLQGALGLAPLARLQKNVADIRSGRLRNLGDDGPSEVRPLVNEINMLIEERETALSRARARASDLAHGLKTPLTVLSNLAESLPPAERDTALKQVELIRQRSDRQLQAARLGVEQMATFEVSGLISKLVQVLRPVTAEKNINWKIMVPDGLNIGIDPADFAEVAGNILDNAGKWARSIIRVTAVDGIDTTTIRIADDGPGIAEGERENVLKRGHRVDDQSTGHGLGLAIAQDIVTAYSGRIEITSSDLGGADFIISFPRHPSGPKQSVPH